MEKVPEDSAAADAPVIQLLDGANGEIKEIKEPVCDS